MAKIATLFWDIGGVLLTNGWDRHARRRAVEKFQLDWDEFEDRHELVVAAFEKGELSLDDYLEHTVFYCDRKITKQNFQEFMFAQSKPDAAALALIERVASSRKCTMAMLNNESLELNEYRIREFGLRKYFSVFLSSCYLGSRKPEKPIYRMALQLTQCAPQEALLIDDRVLNVEAAQKSQMNALRFTSAGQCEKDLRAMGVEW